MISTMFNRKSTLFAVTLLPAMQASAGPLVNPGVPPMDGNMTVDVTKHDGTTVTINIPIFRRGDNNDARRLDKAEQIAAGIASATNPPINASVNATGKVDVDAKSVKLGKNTTGETDKIVAGGPVLNPTTAVCSWAGNINEIGIGGPVRYETMIGWDGFEASTNFGSGDIAQPTVDGLLSRAYSGLLAGLPPQMQMNLHLDLANDQMTFDFPTGVNDAYFGAGNLSTTSWPVFSVTSVPEPAALALAPLGFAMLRRYRR